MLKYFIALLSFMSFFQLKAQDYIIINNKDTIECVINEVGDKKIYFTVTNDGKEYHQSLLLSQVNNYYFNHSADVKKKKITNSSSTPTEPFENTLRVGLYYGLGYSVGKAKNVSPDLDDYVDELRSGANFTLEAHYFPGKKNYGIGVKMSRFTTKNEIAQVGVVDNLGNIRVGLLRDDVTQNFIGGSLILRWLKPNNVNGFYFDMAFGKSFYKDKGILIDRINLKADDFSINLALSYDIKLSNYFAFGFSIAYNWVNFDYLELNGKPFESEQLGLNGKNARINALLGIKTLIH